MALHRPNNHYLHLHYHHLKLLIDLLHGITPTLLHPWHLDLHYHAAIDGTTLGPPAATEDDALPDPQDAITNLGTAQDPEANTLTHPTTLHQYV